MIGKPAKDPPGKLGIPKKLGHIWIGDRKPPTAWMDTWKAHHPSWEYTLFDNDYLTSRRWRTQPMIVEYFSRRRFEGVSDLMRYELLYEQGGFLPEADSTCLKPVDDLFGAATVYAAWERDNDTPDFGTHFISPYCAAAAGHATIQLCLKHLLARYYRDPAQMGPPWGTVGNKFLGQLYLATKHEITIFPHTYFNPFHHKDIRTKGFPTEVPEDAYSIQHWANTFKSYEKYPEPQRAAIFEDTLAKLRARL